jgi:hypothetical protein
MSDTRGSNTKKELSIAAITFTYNENINLPLWIKYYGAQCGENNLFIADRGSTDGSIHDIGEANLMKLPRNEFDEHGRTVFINELHAALLKFYDVVIYTDCDEFLIPDPAKFESLRTYIHSMSGDYARAIGVDVLHIINEELPLDLSRPILSQRCFGRFGSASCKALIARAPIRWLTGFHSCDKNVPIDPSLILFHLKAMDYAIAVNRQVVNQETVWSKRSIDENLGVHHRWDMKTFVQNLFFVPADIYARNGFVDFEFSGEIEAFQDRTTLANGSWYIPMDMHKFVRFPDRFRALI